MVINNGDGLYDKYGLIDSIISQINNLPIVGVAACSTVCDIYNKLTALKKGLKEEEAPKDGE